MKARTRDKGAERLETTGIRGFALDWPGLFQSDLINTWLPCARQSFSQVSQLTTCSVWWWEHRWSETGTQQLRRVDRSKGVMIAVSGPVSLMVVSGSAPTLSPKAAPTHCTRHSILGLALRWRTGAGVYARTRALVVPLGSGSRLDGELNLLRKSLNAYPTSYTMLIRRRLKSKSVPPCPVFLARPHPSRGHHTQSR